MLSSPKLCSQSSVFSKMLTWSETEEVPGQVWVLFSFSFCLTQQKECVGQHEQGPLSSRKTRGGCMASPAVLTAPLPKAGLSEVSRLRQEHWCWGRSTQAWLGVPGLLDLLEQLCASRQQPTQAANLTNLTVTHISTVCAPKASELGCALVLLSQ